MYVFCFSLIKTPHTRAHLSLSANFLHNFPYLWTEFQDLRFDSRKSTSLPAHRHVGCSSTICSSASGTNWIQTWRESDCSYKARRRSLMLITNLPVWNNKRTIFEPKESLRCISNARVWRQEAPAGVGVWRFGHDRYPLCVALFIPWGLFSFSYFFFRFNFSCRH